MIGYCRYMSIFEQPNYPKLIILLATFKFIDYLLFVTRSEQKTEASRCAHLTRDRVDLIGVGADLLSVSLAED